MELLLREKIKEGIRVLFNAGVDDALVQVQETRKDFKGDYTFVVFPVLRYSGMSPELTGEKIGIWLLENFPSIAGYNVIKGFLNLTVSEKWWLEYFERACNNDLLEGCRTENPETILVEYSSPNTNKPLHLGHIRNNLLGFSLYRILNACGHRVVKTNIVNDRGIHICKSMLAWQKFGNGETPASSGIKGDHLVGKYYVMFESELKLQAELLVKQGISEEEARGSAPLMIEARNMLLKWESGDPETVALWKMMNDWVYEGFDQTYHALGVDFDRIYYESETYKDGKEIVEKGLNDKVLYKKEDGSVWADLTEEGLDHKLLLRSDGTAVYMTQDLGTAALRHHHYGFDKCIYVVGNEQNYHFQVLRSILKKMGYPWAGGLIHFSYGMVELPEGKMKSREGTVVDADDLITEMKETAREVSLELGKLEDYTDSEKEEIFRKIGLGALKYFILKVDPRKNMTFNPAESIDFNGNTGPFIQYTYARIKSVLKKAEQAGTKYDSKSFGDVRIAAKEVGLIRLIRKFAPVVSEAAASCSPALVANYCYDLAREYNQFYHEYTILGEKDEAIRSFRLSLSELTGNILHEGMGLLGIEMPGRM